MTPFIDEAKYLLRIARRDYQTFTILRHRLPTHAGPGGVGGLLTDINVSST
jgi:hypothetical protein